MLAAWPPYGLAIGSPELGQIGRTPAAMTTGVLFQRVLDSLVGDCSPVWMMNPELTLHDSAGE